MNETSKYINSGSSLFGKKNAFQENVTAFTVFKKTKRGG